MEDAQYLPIEIAVLLRQQSEPHFFLSPYRLRFVVHKKEAEHGIVENVMKPFTSSCRDLRQCMCASESCLKLIPLLSGKQSHTPIEDMQHHPGLRIAH